jgi:hypothetical protein
MSETKYIEWVPGYGSKINAEEAYSELERIRGENDGELTASIVVEEAKEKTSILHLQVFDRGQRAAAAEYYKDNARLLLRSLIVRHEATPDMPTRVYPVIREERSAVSKGRTAKIYGDIEEALSDPIHRQYVLAQALRDAATWRKRYAALSELAQVFTAIDSVAANVL